MAIIALTTSDPFVLGETSGVAVPTGGEFEGADLRAFGISRAHMCSLLRKHAVELAKEEDVMVVCSKENAATCILLDYLGLCESKLGSCPLAGWDLI